MKSEFGWIEIDKIRYNYDVIIHGNGSVNRRSKKKSKDLKRTYGHTSSLNMNWIFLRMNSRKKSLSEPDRMAIYLSTPTAGDMLSQFKTIISRPQKSWICGKKNTHSFAAIIHVTC